MGGKMLTKPVIARLRVQYDKLYDLRKQAQPMRRETDISWEDVQAIDPSHAKKDNRLIWALYTKLSAVLRNDFVDVKLVESEKDATDESVNYFVRDSSKFTIHQHKTSGRYGALELEVPPEVAALIPKEQVWLFEKNGVPMKKE